MTRSRRSDRLRRGTMREGLSRKTIFRREWKAWTAVVLYILFLYSTLGVAFDLYVSVYDRIGREAVSWRMNTAFVAIGLLIFCYVLWRVRPSVAGYLALLLIAGSIAFALSYLEVPAKRFHYFQYGPLTLLLFDALRFRTEGRETYITVLFLVTLVGLGDESIQWLLPTRHFGILDLVINSSAGLLVLAFIGFVLGDENYPPGA